ncbi:hypothetical protein [Candidatus Pelagadaptatus aseana]|uniref:hypothetical protein n=1 Tax=Candidatus Pelagadaptatus aseana TaxID=3120508 RepID=UPI003C6EF842
MALEQKPEAVREVMAAIHRAGRDIEQARIVGGEALQEIVKIVRKHIPTHTVDAIVASLNADLRVINYDNLNIDKPGMEQIMGLALEAGILKTDVDLDQFAHDLLLDKSGQMAGEGE